MQYLFNLDFSIYCTVSGNCYLPPAESLEESLGRGGGEGGRGRGQEGRCGRGRNRKFWGVLVCSGLFWFFLNKHTGL